MELFVDELEMICIFAREYLNERNITFQRAERKRALGRFEKAEAELYNLIDKRRDPKLNVPLKEKGNLLDFSIYQDSTVILERQRLHYLVLAAASQLKEIIALLKEETRNPGRPSADAATGDLVKIIAHGFNNFFERPTSHIHKDQDRHGVVSGVNPSPFYPLVQIALEACGLPYEDPSRHIRAALKTLP
ncbi:MAG: hypothetical protein R6W88_01310 [Desulfobacterales bacterium]